MPVQRRSKVTVIAIQEAAAQVLEDYGLEGFTTNAIASRAGVSIGTLYQYYPNKSAIAAALSSKVRIDMIRRINDAVKSARGLPLKKGLFLLATASIQMDESRPKFAKCIDEMEVNQGINRSGTITVDQDLNELIFYFLESKFSGASFLVLKDTADDLRVIGGALANAALRRGSGVGSETVEKIVTVFMALINARLGPLHNFFDWSLICK